MLNENEMTQQNASKFDKLLEYETPSFFPFYATLLFPAE